MKTMNSSLKNSAPDLPQKLQQNLISSFRLLDGFSCADLIESEFMTKFVSGLPIPWMNNVLQCTAPGAILNALVHNTLKAHHHLNCPLIWKVSALLSERSRMTQVLRDNGFSLQDTEVAMVLDPKKFSYSRNMPELKVEKVAVSSKVKDWLIPFVDSFSIPKPFGQYFERSISSRITSTKETWFVAYLNESPVSSASCLIDSGVSMIYNLATIEKFRGRGYARLVIEAAIAQTLETDKLPIAVFASSQAFPLFRNMGFDELYDVENYLYEPRETMQSVANVSSQSAHLSQGASTHRI